MDYSEKLKTLSAHIDDTEYNFNTDVLTALKAIAPMAPTDARVFDAMWGAAAWGRYRDIQDLFYNSKKQLDNAQELLVNAIDNPTKKNITNVENSLELFNTKWRQAREYSLIGMLSV